MKQWIDKYNVGSGMRVALIFAALMTFGNVFAWGGKYPIFLAHATIYSLLVSCFTALCIEVEEKKRYERKWWQATTIGMVSLIVLVLVNYYHQEVLKDFSDYFTREERMAMGMFMNETLTVRERLFFITIRSLLFMAVMWLAINNENNKKRRRKAEARLEQALQGNLKRQMGLLREQMSPHFLFNAFATLSSMTEEVKAKRFISKLSDVYRYLLTSNDYREKHLVTLEKELKFALAYLYVLRERYEDALTVETEVDAKVMKRELPPFALQVLVENATKHNVISSSSPLRITIRSVNEDWIEVRNNIQEKKTKMESFGIGLYNINEQYDLVAKRQIECERTESEFIVRLPLIKS